MDATAGPKAAPSTPRNRGVRRLLAGGADGSDRILENYVSTDVKLEHPKLHWAARLVCGLLGAALIAGAGLLMYKPPLHETISRDSKDFQVTRVSEPMELGSAVVAILFGGLGVLLFALNGYRFSKFSAGGVSAESDAVAQSAAKDLAKPNDETTPIKIDKGAEPDPQPTQPAVGSVVAEDGEYAVYQLSDVPVKVVTHALSALTAQKTAPDTLSDFEYASRKKGKGNHAWRLKFRGKPPIVVTYGGQAKSLPTVSGA